MSDPKRRESPESASATDRESRTEALLVEGLDHYFQANFEEAIHIWTRLLFIDRTHARARAYINRARTALGERARRAEEMLHAAGEVLDAGDLDQARRLLATAEQTSGSDEKVAELWARLERVERSRPATGRGSSPAIVDVRPLRTWRWTTTAVVQGLAIAACGVLLATVVASPVVGEWIAGRAGASPTQVPAPDSPVTVLSADDVTLVRARNLYERGRLTEALAVLRQAEAASGSRDRTDQLRIEIQRWLLMSRRDGVSPLSAASLPDGGRP
jgi:tetratricopeptide (TPR) repeat protein